MSARVLVAGTARGEAVVLEQPLSFWGGVDPETGTIIDRLHPQLGASLARRVVVMPYGRGSSSSSTILAEAIRLATAPVAMLLREADPILALGANVAQELYGRSLPIVVLSPDDYGAIHTGDTVTVDAGEGRAEPLVWSVRLTGEPG